MMHSIDWHPNSNTTYVMEQEVHCSDCILPPPYACATKGNVYHLKDRKNGSSIGKITEKPSCICKTCMCPDARSAVTEIEFFGKKYEVVKDCKYGYLMPGCCCCRPDAYVNKNGVTIGYIKLPCCPGTCC